MTNYHNMEDGELVSRAIAGDTKAFERLFVLYYLRLQRLCYRFTNNRDEADDLAKDTCVAIFKALPNFRRDALFSTWAYRICINICLSWRDNPRRRHEDSTPLDELPEEAGEDIDWSNNVWLNDALLKLPSHYRDVFVLRHIYDMSYEEILQQLGGTMGAIKMRLFHARQRLRELLEQQTGSSACPLACRRKDPRCPHSCVCDDT